MKIDLSKIEAVIVKDNKGEILDRLNIEAIEVKGKRLIVIEKPN